MNYRTILSKEQHILFLMQRLSLLREMVEVKKISHHPDYDFSDYRGPISQTYFFKDEQSLPCELFSVYSATIMDTRVLHADDIRELAESLDLEFVFGEDSEEWILGEAISRDEDAIAELGYDSLSQFALKQLEIIEIDNSAGCVKLQGSFDGDSHSIAQPDWALYAVICFRGFAEDFNDSEFYRQLLVESYMLRSKGDHRVSYFLAYSALEGFINRKLNSENDSGRLSEKSREVFRLRFPGAELSRHQIYTNVVNDFNNVLTVTRNGIAHGRVISIDEQQSRHMLLVALMFICSVELQAETFDELFCSRLVCR